MERRRLAPSDWISIGLYSLLYFIMVGISALLCVFIIPGYSYVYIPVISALLSGPVFMLAHAKVPKFGMIFTMALVMGIFFLVSGRFPLAILPAIIFGFLSDGINHPFHYRNRWVSLVSYVLFSFGPTGPIWPLFFAPERYAYDLASDGKNVEYIASVFEAISLNTGWLVLILLFIASIIGGLFGQYLLKKHFKRAGIV